MNKLELVTQELNKMNVFDVHKNKTAEQMSEILGEDIPFPMSLTIANYTMATFSGHFHLKIKLAEDNLIPCNVIAFVLAKSGAKKTSSMLKLEKALKEGYNVIQRYRYQKAEQLAEETETDVKHPAPLSNALATEAGMIQRLNDFAREGIGLPSLYVDEISTELASNADMIPNIKLVAQLFDVGDMKSKPLKDRAQQSEEVHGMGMSALFIGSEHGILEDESVQKKFETEFMSKLARRSYFVYPDFIDEEEEINSIDDLINSIDSGEEKSREILKEVSLRSRELASKAIETDYMNIELDDDASRLYKLYKVYCEESSKLDTEYEAVQLEHQHRHWKAFKLAGVYAFFNGNSEVTEQDLKEAIYVSELNGSDLTKFMYKANRQKYEILLDHYLEGGQILSAHQMVKKKWIQKTGAPLKSIVELANSKLGSKGMLEITENNTVEFKSFETTEGLGTSYIMVEGTKEERQARTAVGYIYKKTTFEKIGNLLKNDTAYCPFEFKGGIRGKDYILGGADYIVLDVDDDGITDEEASDLLCDYNHIIARTSSNTPEKFRVIMPTDITVDIENDKWKPFMKKVSEHLGIKIDLLPKSQIYYGYKGRELIINSDMYDLPASDLVKNLEAVSPKAKRLVGKAKANAIDDSFNTYKWFYENEDKGYHNTLWLLSVQLHDNGLDFEQAVEIINDVIDYRTRKPRADYLESLHKRMRGYDGWMDK
ncbi:MAG: hypothetical protein K0U20_09290 [Proteobacteria bacterium]|nr:hypothetical protein [Pseudomonadota bacterium]MCH9735774.1 hypothetical protein [Actinomycetes bacterium]